MKNLGAVHRRSSKDPRHRLIWTWTLKLTSFHVAVPTNEDRRHVSCFDFIRQSLMLLYRLDFPKIARMRRAFWIIHVSTKLVYDIHFINGFGSAESAEERNQNSLFPTYSSPSFLSEDFSLSFPTLSSPPSSEFRSANRRLLPSPFLSLSSLLLRRPSSRLRFWCRSNEDDLSPRPPWFCWLTTRPLISFGLFRRSCAKTTSSTHPFILKRSISSRASRAWSGSAYSIKAKPFACCE
mmetsp:Transcript_19209/g.39513  ORF Transcript_19209/g.39513 Transcript_19209/m.39513 type:complete len:237 (-) Transcript_19209:814-1524(-)